MHLHTQRATGQMTADETVSATVALGLQTTLAADYIFCHCAFAQHKRGPS